MLEIEKNIYNTYLAVSRSSRNKPFKLRTDFTDFETTPEYSYVKKLCCFFMQFPQIKQQIFFEAPYKLYQDEDWFDIKFYTTQKAVACYTNYFKTMIDDTPDSKENISFIKESLKYIGMFCIKNNIQLIDYKTHLTGNTLTMLRHIREHNVSIYTIFGLEDIMDVLYKIPLDELDLFLNCDIQKLNIYKNRYSTSKIAKQIIKEGLNRVGSFVTKNIGEKHITQKQVE